MIVVLAIRPWGGDAAAAGERRRRSRRTAPARPRDARSIRAPRRPPAPPVGPEAGLASTCGSPSGWRAATLQAWAGRERADPVVDRDRAGRRPPSPLDPSIPFAPVATGVVTAIGYCAPLGDAERPPAVAVASLWALAGDGAVPLTLLPLEPAAPDALGGLWLRPPEVTGDLAGAPSPGAGSLRRAVVVDAGRARRRRALAARAIRDRAARRRAATTTDGSGIESPTSPVAGTPAPVARAVERPRRVAQRRGGSSQMSNAARAMMIAPSAEIQKP